MTENDTHEYARAAGSLAVHGARQYKELDKSDRPTKTGSKLFFVESDPGYSTALDRVLTESQKLQPRSLKERLLGATLKVGGLDEKIMRTGIRLVARGDLESDTVRSLFGDFNKIVDGLPNAINKWIEEGGVEEGLIPDLRKVEDGLRKGDMMLKTKIAVDAIRADLDKYGIDLRDQRNFIRMWIQHNIPEVKNIRPETIDIKVLENLQNYGLMDILPVHMYLRPEGYSSGYGEAYRRNIVDDYRGRPKPDEVSSTPYQDRIRKWELEKREYEDERQILVTMLNSFDQHYENEGLERGYDIVWARRNLGNIRKGIEEILDSSATKRIIEFSNHPRVEPYEYSKLGRGRANFGEVAKALKVVFEFASENDTTSADELLQSGMLAFRDMIMGLYNIEEAKGR